MERPCHALLRSLRYTRTRSPTTIAYHHSRPNLQTRDILHDFIAYQKHTMLTDTNTSVNFTALSLSGMHSATTSAHQENQVDAPSRQHGHHPIPKRIKAYLRACINTHSSRAGGDHKRKRPKFVMSPKAQGLVSNTHHGKKHMLKNCTHDRMSGGKAAQRSNSGATAKKTTFLDETNHAAVSLTPKEDD